MKHVSDRLAQVAEQHSPVDLLHDPAHAQEGPKGDAGCCAHMAKVDDDLLGPGFRYCPDQLIAQPGTDVFALQAGRDDGQDENIPFHARLRMTEMQFTHGSLDGVRTPERCQYIALPEAGQMTYPEMQDHCRLFLPE